MLFHMSISADDPEHVSGVIAELWGGEHFPFTPVAVGSWVAHAGDDRNTAMEVYPRGTELMPSRTETKVQDRSAPRGNYGATHAAIATPLPPDKVFEIARREGWHALYDKRANAFGVIEFWIENSVMLEVLTPEMQQEYLDTMTLEKWRAAMPPARAPLAAA